MKTKDMIKPQNKSQQTYVFIGILLTSSILLAAFTYSEKEKLVEELENVEPTKIEFTIEQTIKPKEKKPIVIPKNEKKSVTTNLKKNVTTSTKLIKNNMILANPDVVIKGLDLNFDPDPKYKIIDVVPTVVDFPDKEAEFTGGFNEMNKYIIHNLNLNTLHELIQEDEILVHVEFIVSEEGEIIDVKLKESIEFELKFQIQQLMKRMPPWVPAELKGRKVSSRIFLPIRIHFQ